MVRFQQLVPKSKAWFKDNIPLYELDCLLGADPFSHSLQEFCGLPVEKIYTTPQIPTSTTTSSHSTGSISISINTLADTFKAISRALINSQQTPMPDKSIQTTTTTQLPTQATTIPTTPDFKTPVKHLNYSTMDFGTPPEMGGFQDPCMEEPMCLDDWDF